MSEFQLISYCRYGSISISSKSLKSGTFRGSGAKGLEL